MRGHHVYKGELDNEHNRFAVAVSKSTQTVGHMPCEISRISRYFLEQGTNGISCKITDKRQCSKKGLEVLCIYVFGKPPHIHKLIDFSEELITFIVIGLSIFVVY